MKKFLFALILAALILLSACAKDAPVTAAPETDPVSGTAGTKATAEALFVGEFSYEEAEAHYGAAEGEAIRRDGFVNVDPALVTTGEEAVERAGREVTAGRYVTHNVYRDPATGAWLVAFGMGPDVCGGSADVYLSSEGVTLLIVYGE